MKLEIEATVLGGEIISVLAWHEDLATFFSLDSLPPYDFMEIRKHIRARLKSRRSHLQLIPGGVSA